MASLSCRLGAELDVRDAAHIRDGQKKARPSMNTRLEKLRALSWSERAILFKAALLLPLFWLGLRLFGLARFGGWLDRSSAKSPSGAPITFAVTLGRLVNAAANHSPVRATCLTRSLLLRWMLRRRGIDSQLRIGVRLVQDALEAHAWIEIAGHPINDAPGVARRFAPFAGPVSMRSFSSWRVPE